MYQSIVQNALHIIEPPSIDSELPYNDETLDLLVIVPDPKPTPAWIAFSIAYTGSDNYDS